MSPEVHHLVILSKSGIQDGSKGGVIFSIASNEIWIGLLPFMGLFVIYYLRLYHYNENKKILK